MYVYLQVDQHDQHDQQHDQEARDNLLLQPPTAMIAVYIVCQVNFANGILLPYRGRHSLPNSPCLHVPSARTNAYHNSFFQVQLGYGTNCQVGHVLSL